MCADELSSHSGKNCADIGHSNTNKSKPLLQNGHETVVLENLVQEEAAEDQSEDQSKEQQLGRKKKLLRIRGHVLLFLLFLYTQTPSTGYFSSEHSQPDESHPEEQEESGRANEVLLDTHPVTCFYNFTQVSVEQVRGAAEHLSPL